MTAESNAWPFIAWRERNRPLDGRVRQEIIKRFEMLKQKVWKNCVEVHPKGNLSDFWTLLILRQDGKEI